MHDFDIPDLFIECFQVNCPNVSMQFSMLTTDHQTTGGGVCTVIRLGTDFVKVVVPSKFETLELLAFDIICVHTKERYILC